MRPKTEPLNAFTLVELLIVVAIIGILAAIAVPKLQDAVLRAKIAYMIAEHGALLNGMVAYHADYGTYHQASWLEDHYRPLTTPIAYISRLPVNIFYQGEDHPLLHGDLLYMELVVWLPYREMGSSDPDDAEIRNICRSTGYLMSPVPEYEYLEHAPGVYWSKYDGSGTRIVEVFDESGFEIVTPVPGDPISDYKWRRDW